MRLGFPMVLSHLTKLPMTASMSYNIELRSSRTEIICCGTVEVDLEENLREEVPTSQFAELGLLMVEVCWQVGALRSLLRSEA